MKLAPGEALSVLLGTDPKTAPTPVARVVMARGVAQLEWSAQILKSALRARIAGIVDQVSAAVDRWPKVAGDTEVGAASAREIAGRVADIRGRF